MRLQLLVGLSAAVLIVQAGPCLAAEPPTPAARAARDAGAARAMDRTEQRDVLEKLATALADNFVFPDVGARYAAALRGHLAKGDYDQLTDPTAFAARVTADLQAVSADGHLRLYPHAADAPSGPAGSGEGPPRNWGLEETRMIGQVAYLRFNAFPDDPQTSARARQFLLDHADAKAVIIDSRPNHGGGLAVMDAILPLLYDKPATLVRMDTRASVDNPMTYASLVRQASPATVVRNDHQVTPDRAERRLQHAPVYYLTSHATASAAEHLALAFRHTHRAVQIGETTRGAGHYGGLEDLGPRFSAFIPVGRTYDPDTNWDWEGVGVAPDVAVPADRALDEALARAKAAGARVD